VKKYFQAHADKIGDLKSILGGTRPFRNKTVQNEALTPVLGEYIDRFALNQIFLWYLAPKRRGESVDEWDRKAREAQISTEEMGVFIESRMPQALRTGHPKQPLMWKRLLAYLVTALSPWPSQGKLESKSNVTLATLTTGLFLSTPFLDPADDRLLSRGGAIEVPGGALYGVDIPPQLLGKLIKQTRLKLAEGNKGLEIVAGEEMREGDIAAIYVASIVRCSNPGIESRYAISGIGLKKEKQVEEPVFYVARFTPTMSVRWYIDEKRSAGPFLNAPDPGNRPNCKLQRAMAWTDDKDRDSGYLDLGYEQDSSGGLFFKIFPILVDVDIVKEGEPLTFTYKPFAGHNRNYADCH